MKIDLLTEKGSWREAPARLLARRLRALGHRATVIFDAKDIAPGELLFIIGFLKIIPPPALRRHRHNLVLHESALPKGRGWSPVSWQILAGARRIPLTVFEAAARVDEGAIYLRRVMTFRGDELIDEIRAVVSRHVHAAIETFVKRYPAVVRNARVQTGRATYYRRRTPDDGRLNVNRPLKSQFNLLRISDNDQYPAFFDWRGSRYRVRVDKLPLRHNP